MGVNLLKILEPGQQILLKSGVHNISRRERAESVALCSGDREL